MEARNVAFAFCVLCVVCVFAEINASRKLIVVLIDGVRWDYLNDPDLKGFRRLAENGVKAPYVVPIHPSLSYPNWYSIVTGLYAENHGFVDNHMYDSSSEMWFRGYNAVDSTDPQWWNEAEPIWITAEKNNLTSALYWWGGCEVRIDKHHPTICERERYGPPTPEEKEDFIERIDDIVEMFKPSKRFSKDRLSLVLMYYGSTDYVGHHDGPKSVKMKDTLREIDGILDKMQSKLAKAGLKDEVNIMVVSDHGMTDVKRNKPISLKEFRKDIKYQVSAGAQSLIVPRDGMVDKLYNDLKKANMKGIKVYKKEEIPLKYYIKHSKWMTPIYLMAEKNYTIQWLYDEIASVSNVASHGYDPEQYEDMRTIFLASGPDFKKDYKTEPLNITDLYNVMCNILQITPLPNNGSWEKVSPMLIKEQHLDILSHTFSSSSVLEVELLMFLTSLLSFLVFTNYHKNL